MARAVAEGQLTVTPDLLEHELNCLVCDACSAVCPAGVHMDPLQVVLRRGAGRPAAARLDRPRRAERGLRLAVHGHGAGFGCSRAALWLYQRSGVRWLARHLGILRAAAVWPSRTAAARRRVDAS